MHLIIRLLVNAIALYVIAQFLPGFHVDGFTHAVIAALVLGIANAIVRPILILISLPLEIITLGLFTFVVNALVLWLVAKLVPGFRVDGFGPAFLGALVLSIVSFLLSHLFAGNRERRAA
ncbi:MAG: phage holin family protein [Candidatus Eremiobacteraeota bacterium]|nr:phage holin family protein [Candidatus Eremiobacteraeota bacterium]